MRDFREWKGRKEKGEEELRMVVASCKTVSGERRKQCKRVETVKREKEKKRQHHP